MSQPSPQSSSLREALSALFQGESKMVPSVIKAPSSSSTLQNHGDADRQRAQQITAEIQNIEQTIQEQEKVLLSLRELHRSKLFDLACHELLYLATTHPLVLSTNALIEKAKVTFFETLAAPQGYADETEVPYTESDDYADVSCFEEVTDELLEKAELLISGSHEKENKSVEGDQNSIQDAVMVMFATAMNLKVIHHLVNSHRSTSEVDEILESIAAQWEELMTCETKFLSYLQANRRMWKEVFVAVLGPPFDALANLLKEEEES